MAKHFGWGMIMRIWAAGILAAGLLISGAASASAIIPPPKPKDAGPQVFHYTLTFSGTSKADKAGTHIDVRSVAKLPRTFDRTIAGGQNTVSFKSYVTLRKKQPGTFYEKGTIIFGSGTLMFKTAAPGTMAPSPAAGMDAGHVIWQVTGGTGAFTGASGTIASVFTSREDGSLTDSHAGVIFLK